jgi:hypothetical protein
MSKCWSAREIQNARPVARFWSKGPVSRRRVERTMFASKAELKTKGLVLGNGPLLHWAFMKFRGPKALNDKLAVIRTYSGVDVVVFPDG